MPISGKSGMAFYMAIAAAIVGGFLSTAIPQYAALPPATNASQPANSAPTTQKTFNSKIELEVYAITNDGSAKYIGQTPSEKPLPIPKCKYWYVAASLGNLKTKVDELANDIKNQNVPGLYLSYHGGGDNPIKLEADLLKGFKNLRYLNINTDISITDSVLAAIAQNTELEFLIISSARDVSDAGWKALENLTEMRELTLQKATINDSTIPYLTAMMQLKKLTIRFEGQFSEKGMETIGKLTELRELSLSDILISDEDLKKLGKLEYLEKLSINATGAIGNGLQCLTTFANLRILDIRGVNIRDNGTKYIGQLAGLEELHISGAGMGNSELENLSKLKNLQSFYLTTNVTKSDGSSLSNIGDEGMAHLSAMESLETLHLGGLPIGDAGIDHLTKLKKLRDLSLCNTNISDGCVESLVKITTLEKLSLAQTKLTDKGFNQLGGLKNLKELSISLTGITDAGLDGIKSLSKLVTLDIYGTAITSDGIKSLTSLKDLQNITVSAKLGIKDDEMRKIFPKLRMFMLAYQ